MPKPPNLTSVQKERLHVLEPALRDAARRGDYRAAKQHAADIQSLLRASGHETRLMQAKNWLFQAAMEAGELGVAIAGFSGIRQKVSTRTRVYLEATALLAICHIRQRNVTAAEPLMAEVLVSKNIKSEARRRKFLRLAVRKFEEEGVLAALRGYGHDTLDATELESQAGLLIQTQTDDQILAGIGSSIPREVTDFLLKVDAAAKRSLTAKEIKYLPPPEDLVKNSEVGRTVFGSLKVVLWRSLCNPESEIYKAWFSRGFSFVLSKKYFGTVVAAAMIDLGIGIKALAVSVTAMVIKMGVEVYCEHCRPEGIMDARSGEE